jgi:hypothetical protein
MKSTKKIKRTPFQRERDLERVTQLYLQGLSQYAIADIIGTVTRSQIARDIQEIQKRWREAGLINFNEAVNRELARVDRLEATHWRAWEKSFAGDGEGNPAFLAGALRCSEHRSRILGLFAPERKEFSGPNAGPFHLMTDNERIAKIVGLLDTARTRSLGSSAESATGGGRL